MVVRISATRGRFDQVKHRRTTATWLPVVLTRGPEARGDQELRGIRHYARFRDRELPVGAC